MIIHNIDERHWVSKAVTADVRPHDRGEFALIHPDLKLQEAISASFTLSVETWGFVKDCTGQPLGIGGICENGSIWFIGSAYADTLSSRKYLLEVGRRLVRQGVATYGEVWNLCSSDPGQLKAMASLGFTVTETPRENVRLICAS